MKAFFFKDKSLITTSVVNCNKIGNPYLLSLNDNPFNLAFKSLMASSLNNPSKFFNFITSCTENSFYSWFKSLIVPSVASCAGKVVNPNLLPLDTASNVILDKSHTLKEGSW